MGSYTRASFWTQPAARISTKDARYAHSKTARLYTDGDSLICGNHHLYTTRQRRSQWAYHIENQKYTMYDIFPLPVASSAVITAYRALWLTSLQVEPSCFGPDCASEAALSDDVWRERMNSPCRKTFIASKSSQSSQHTTYKDGGSATRDTVASVGDAWIGTVTIQGPSVLDPSSLVPLEKIGIGGSWEPYFVVAMWVHPDHRGKGIGHELVARGLDWARQHKDPKFAGDAEKEKVVLPQCRDYNARGRALYTKAGFRDLVDVPVENDVRWMLVKL